METKKEIFEYTYSAKRQDEIERIRKKYLPKEDDKMEQLRKLDRDTTKPGTILAITMGVAGCLLLGVGMCCILVWEEVFFTLGIVVGVIGMALIGVAYPAYAKTTQIQRERVAPQILALAEELSQ